MNFIQAFKTRKPFKRKNQPNDWFNPNDGSVYLCIRKEDVLAEDFVNPPEPPIIFETIIMSGADYTFGVRDARLATICGKRVRVEVTEVE